MQFDRVFKSNQFYPWSYKKINILSWYFYKSISFGIYYCITYFAHFLNIAITFNLLSVPKWPTYLLKSLNKFRSRPCKRNQYKYNNMVSLLWSLYWSIYLRKYAANFCTLRWRWTKIRINYNGHHIFAALPVNFRRVLHAWFACKLPK